jgi:hypothetical protein
MSDLGDSYGPKAPNYPNWPYPLPKEQVDAEEAKPSNAYDFVGSGVAIDYDKLEATIREICAENFIGWGYAICEGPKLTRSGGAGAAVLSRATGKRRKPFNEHTRMTIASLSKTVTASAIVRALLRRGLSVDHKIKNFLPAHFELGPGLEDTTFRQLMAMDAGLLSLGETTDDDTAFSRYVRLSLKMGDRRNSPEWEGPYQNVNYGLLRILLPYLSDELVVSHSIPTTWDQVCEVEGREAWALATATYYANYVARHVLSRAPSMGEFDTDMSCPASVGT